jgi:hypothetical protein
METELDLWRSTLSAKEIALHKLAAIKLKKELQKETNWKY